jgi:predicted esterase
MPKRRHVRKNGRMPGTATDLYLTSWTRMANLYLAGRLDEAAQEAELLEVSHPERKTQVRHSRACLAARGGDAALALTLMRSVVDEGSWWSTRQLADGDFDSIRELLDFARLGRIMADRHASDQRIKRPVKVLVASEATAPRALVVALHMYGASAAETMEKWRAAASQLIIAVPESTERDGDGLPCWEDDESADRAVSAALHETHQLATAAGLAVILAGASQGASHAVRIALTGRVVNCRGVLTVVGAPPTAHLLWPVTPERMRAFGIAGSEDNLTRGSQERLNDELTAHGIASRLEVVPGLEHQYPENLTELVGHALDFILT